MQSHVRPVYCGARLAGYAMTVHAVSSTEPPPADRSLWYKRELEAVDRLEPADVMVVSTCDGPFWGELLATAARYRGAVGLVADAGVRDTSQLTEMRFPTFAARIEPTDALGRCEVNDVMVPIECGGVTVHPGDVVIADNDGVVVVPAAAARDVLQLAEEKSGSEDIVRRELERGMSARDAFLTYGVL
jgi:4-hydroxy-4-methyl-2-oxoglutarate aldolase